MKMKRKPNYFNCLFSMLTMLSAFAIGCSDGDNDNVTDDVENQASQNDIKTFGVVTNPVTGRIWMDRNLGASRVATSSTDAEGYGDLYQWGRAADGHQKRNSPIAKSQSGTDNPGHGDFIIFPNPSGVFDWRSPQNDDLWQGVNGTNNPCPEGFRIPTEEEWKQELATWSGKNAEGAFASPLKLPMGGYRNINDGKVEAVGTVGIYWSSSVGESDSRRLFMVHHSARTGPDNRMRGICVRCIKD